MVTVCGLFEVRTEFLKIIQTSFGFKGLMQIFDLTCYFLTFFPKQDVN
jgi:hypothetical protein